jgi:hypothetical protein
MVMRTDGGTGGMSRIAPFVLALGLLMTACTDSEAGNPASRTPDIVGDSEVPPNGSGITAGDFLELNGWIWFYTTAGEIRFDEITAMLDDLHDGGIRILGIYSPYDGNPQKWLGCAPLDF